MRLLRAFFFLLLLLPAITHSQITAIKNITGLPTKEIYDLHVDSQGFLWVAHDLGLSRYDGINFLSYSAPDQTSLSVTDIVEDHYDRIWFHNFTGQIFYIENNRIHLLKQYDYKSERSFPRLVLLNNELIASSDHGLFICNTFNLKCKYIQCAQALGKGTASMAVLSNCVICCGDGSWFKYTPNQPLKKISIKGKIPAYILKGASFLNGSTYLDTAFLITNPDGILNKITCDGDSLKLSGRVNAGDFINTLSISNKKVFVNTIHKSFELNNPAEQINGYNVTDIEDDQEGNQWFSSLKNGLFIKYKGVTEGLQPITLTGKDDIVKCIEVQNDKLLLGTQNGYVILYNTKKGAAISKIKLPGNSEMISGIYRISEGKYLVGSSVNTYIVDIDKHSTSLLLHINTLKQVALSPQYIIMASAKSLIIYPYKKLPGIADSIKKQFKGTDFHLNIEGNYYEFDRRCRAVCYDLHSQSMYVSFNDGLYVINRKGSHPFLYNNAHVLTTCLRYINGKVVIGTINDGLLITDGIHTTHITTNDGLSSNTILKLKNTGGRVWIMGAGSTVILDTVKFKLVADLNLSPIAEMEILDVKELNNKYFIASSDGFYALTTNNNSQKFTLRNYLQSIYINNKPPADDHKNRFTYYENNIQFNLTIPFYYHANDIYFKYMLQGANNPSWQLTKPGDRSITFSELSPGTYTFRAYAVHPQYGVAVNPIYYKFTITEKWWQSLLFKIGITLLIIAIVTYISATYFLHRLKMQRISYELQLNINNERQRISSEIHDDVGAGLSAIKLLLNMDHGTTPIDIMPIRETINDVSKKITEIIWSTNTENDTLESLLYYIETQSAKLFEYSGIQFEKNIPTDVPDYMISGEKRRNIYLVVIEFLHNALKHSGATKISLNISLIKNELTIIIKDNGKGFDYVNNGFKGMGLKNSKLRSLNLKSKLEVVSNSSGTTISLKIPLN